MTMMTMMTMMMTTMTTTTTTMTTTTTTTMMTTMMITNDDDDDGEYDSRYDARMQPSVGIWMEDVLHDIPYLSLHTCPGTRTGTMPTLAGLCYCGHAVCMRWLE
eukprot:GHVU01131386.1.p3 GENE.GHVU01131386.1~~GHVU01131386.1.p3  ORF type:complete len:104 (+),score=30.23 GHVU01131386.1:2-313(+)